jgi:hypothetical protein
MPALPRMSLKDAQEHLQGCISEDGGLYNLGMYLGWNPGSATACLDGDFTAIDLLAIATYMEHGDA